MIVIEAFLAAETTPFAYRATRGTSFEVCCRYGADIELPLLKDDAILLVHSHDPETDELLGEARLPLARQWPWSNYARCKEIEATRRTDDYMHTVAAEATVMLRNHFGKATLFEPGRDQELRLSTPWASSIEAVAVPGAIGVMKCAYRIDPSLQPSSVEGEGERAADNLIQSNSHSLDVPIVPKPSPDQLDSAARHTHSIGAKWDRNVEAVAENHGQLQESSTVSEPHSSAITQFSDQEQCTVAPFDLDAPAFDGDYRLQEIRDAQGRSFLLRFYVHRGLLLPPTDVSGTRWLRPYLQVFVGGHQVVSTRDAPVQGRVPLFGHLQEALVRFPEFSRLELRVMHRDEADDDLHLGTTVVDLQERWSLAEEDHSMNEQFRELRRHETRTLWAPAQAPFLAVGSLELWTELHDSEINGMQAICDDTSLDPAIWPKGLDKYYCGDKCQEIWPTEVYRYTEAELRVTLHEVEGLDGTLGSDIVVSIGMNVAEQRLVGGAIPEVQVTDVHRGLWRERDIAEFEWRVVFPGLRARNAFVVFCVCDRSRQQIIGEARFDVAEFLGRAQGGLDPAMFRVRDVAVLAADGKRVGCVNISGIAVTQELANQFPAEAGRNAIAAPFSVRQALCGHELRCPLRGRSHFDAPVPPPKPPVRRRKSLLSVVALLFFSCVGELVRGAWSGRPRCRIAPPILFLERCVADAPCTESDRALPRYVSSRSGKGQTQWPFEALV